MKTQKKVLSDLLRKSVAGLARQGFARSLQAGDADDSLCAYRNEKGQRCAIGQLLSDEEAALCPEGSVTASWRFIANRLHLSIGYREFLCALQDAHDHGSDTPAEMRENLRTLAEYWDLPVPKELK